MRAEGLGLACRLGRCFCGKRTDTVSGLQMGYLKKPPQKHSRIARLERIALLLVFLPQEFAFFVRRTRQTPSSHDTLRVPRVQNRFTQYQNKNGHLSATVFVLAGAEGLGLACRLGRCFCTSCRGLRRRPAPLDTLRVPRVQNRFTQYQNKNGHLSATVFVLAGAEGLGLACRLGRCFCTSCRGLRRRPAPLDTLRVPRVQNRFTQYQNKNGHLSATVFVLAGAEGLGLACRLGRCFCTSCRGLRRRPAPLDTLRVPRVQNRFTQYQNKNGHLSATVFVLAGAEGLGLACRLGRCFCTSCRGLRRRPAPLDTLRVPRVQNRFTQYQNKNGHLSATVFVLAGAEGLEPSARGFGDRCSTN